MSHPVKALALRQYPAGQVIETDVDEMVLPEEVLEIRVNGRNFSMTMTTPGDERYLVRGLLHSEGASQSQFLDYQQKKTDHGTLVCVNIPCKPLRGQGRQSASTSSCGLCGKKSAKQLLVLVQKYEGPLISIQNC